MNHRMREVIKTICSLRKDMLKLLVAVPVDGDDHKYLMDKLKMFDKMCHVIMEKEE